VIAIGLMSGTSMDGIDAALVRIAPEGSGVRVATLDFLVAPYPAAVLAALRRAQAGAPLPAAELGFLDVAVGEAFAGAALGLLERPAGSHLEVSVIGSHGQTVAHEPWRGVSVQIGSAAVIAERTGLAVVSDFRARDLAAGGQGAPLVPFADALLLCDPEVPVAALNLGGIANVTVLSPMARPAPPVAFDTGPANMVIDGIIRRMSDGRETVDRDGQRARRGQVSAPLLAELMAEPYFAAPPPKSTGSELFGDAYVERLLGRARELDLGPDDLVATATALSVESIARALRTAGVARVVVSGGGIHNPVLMAGLRDAVPGIKVETSDRYGIDPDAKEAIAFAILAWAHLTGQSASFESVTGARRRAVLGTFTPGRPDPGPRGARLNPSS
jgi:anhydro-N-acetylmuramic acid kinase